ncbi:MAG TPA: hypothetical protein PKI41_08245 [Candidatus Competibacteraceae bacterium]|nr:MAG: hypothetical protein EKK71_00975 [Candidatus Competibacteraceae bacterium]HOB62101.1 hypothetical protein [Candidatus Competibacteraceae bacterium]HQD55184.1 hypothetical protein [Candidatus Competibacteraceae bacterium]
MKTFKEFTNSINTLPALQDKLTNTLVISLQGQTKISENEKEKFSKEISNTIQDQVFISQFSDKIGSPLENESEEDFVKRGSNILRKMLYAKFL